MSSPRSFPSSLVLGSSSRPSLLSTQRPYDALCHYYNVSPTHAHTSLVSTSVDLQIVPGDGHAPTHALALFDPENHTSPVLAPIHHSTFVKGFHTNNFIPQSPSGGTLMPPVPHRPAGLPASSPLFVTLPVVHLIVPHPPSFPLLLLFAMRLERQLNLLAWNLLPSAVIAEFPHAAQMAQVLARDSTLNEAEFQRCFVRNHGLWKNVLAIGPKDSKIVEMVRLVWNVTADAKRLRHYTHSS
jgi:hypothetical protein